MNGQSFRRGALAAVLALVLAGTACTTALTPGSGTGRGHAPNPGSQVPVSARSSAARPTVNAADIDPAVQSVIQRGNDEQVQAISSGNPALMQDTSTARYYRDLVKTNQSLTDNGVTAIKLVNIEWVDATINGTTATATTYETWQTTWADGATDISRDRNVYTLVRDGSSWKIDADDHPDDGQPPASGRGSGGAQPGQPGGAQPTPEPRSPEPQLPRDPNTSTNWSGYAAGGGTFTAVSGTWIVPSSPLDSAYGASAAWVGIGGVRTRDLIQAGTQQVVSGSGRVSYQAWIETLPQASRQVPLTIAPGDSVTVSIDNQGGSTWLVTMTNNSTSQTYTKTVEYQSSLSSAEWIQEAPSIGRRGVVPLDEFGTVQFTNGWATKDGKTVTIAQAGGRSMSMIDRSGQKIAVPSSLGSDGASFAVDRISSSDVSSGRSTGASGTAATQRTPAAPAAPDASVSQAPGGAAGFGSGSSDQATPAPRNRIVPPISRRRFGF